MGFQDRDYYRDDSHGVLVAWSRLGATAWLIVITSVVFFAQCLTGGPARGELTLFGAFIPKEVLGGEVWRLVTSHFLHLTLWSLFWNMLVLYWAGKRLEEMYGSREFLAFYLLSGILINAAGLLAAEAKVPDSWSVIGATGVITAVLVLFAAHFPHEPVMLFFVLRMPVWALAALFVVSDIVFFHTEVGPHVLGAAIGLLYQVTGVRLTGWLPRSFRLPVRRGQPRLRVIRPEPEEGEPVGAAVESQPRPKEAVDEHLEAKLDRILEKVSRHGQDSLTAEEHEILVRASELYKKRRK
jgi:membrane associated rhomboid family serine protease